MPHGEKIPASAYTPRIVFTTVNAVVQTGWVEKPDAPYADGYGEAVVGTGDRCEIIAEKSGKRGGKPPSEDTIIRDCARIEPETLWRCLGFRPTPQHPQDKGRSSKTDKGWD